MSDPGTFVDAFRSGFAEGCRTVAGETTPAFVVSYLFDGTLLRSHTYTAEERSLMDTDISLYIEHGIGASIEIHIVDAAEVVVSE